MSGGVYLLGIGDGTWVDLWRIYFQGDEVSTGSNCSEKICLEKWAKKTLNDCWDDDVGEEAAGSYILDGGSLGELVIYGTEYGDHGDNWISTCEY